MKIEDLGERFREVLHQMKAIGHLRGLGSSLPRPISIGFGPIACDDFDAWVRLQPLG